MALGKSYMNLAFFRHAILVCWLSFIGHGCVGVAKRVGARLLGISVAVTEHALEYAQLCVQSVHASSQLAWPNKPTVTEHSWAGSCTYRPRSSLQPLVQTGEGRDAASGVRRARPVTCSDVTVVSRDAPGQAHSPVRWYLVRRTGIRYIRREWNVCGTERPIPSLKGVSGRDARTVLEFSIKTWISFPNTYCSFFSDLRWSAAWVHGSWRDYGQSEIGCETRARFELKSLNSSDTVAQLLRRWSTQLTQLMASQIYELPLRTESVQRSRCYVWNFHCKWIS